MKQRIKTYLLVINCEVYASGTWEDMSEMMVKHQAEEPLDDCWIECYYEDQH